jgi:hypothetical protein
LLPRGTGSFGTTYANYDLDQLHLDKDGYFEVVLSNERPAAHTGNWWKLNPNATNIVVRQVSYDWLHEVDGRFSIERLDRAAIKPRPEAKEIEANLRQIAEWVNSWTRFSAEWPRKNLRDKGLINKVTVFKVPEGGISTQTYVGGMFELSADEALIYETEVPEKCRYWAVQLTDELFSSIDWMNRQTSLNGHTARIDRDRKFRAVISATDPGVPNWLDTAGYKRGVIYGRWNTCSSNPTPTVRKVKLTDLRNELPSDTPLITAQARDASIRLRRKGAQLRRRW